jgi:energy-converting hydrogenase Eha subunit C
LLGGVVPYDGDPGAGVLLAPIGALLLLLGLLLVVLDLRRAGR